MLRGTAVVGATRRCSSVQESVGTISGTTIVWKGEDVNIAEDALDDNRLIIVVSVSQERNRFLLMVI